MSETKIIYDVMTETVSVTGDAGEGDSAETNLYGYVSFKKLCEEVLPLSGILKPREKVVKIIVTETGIEFGIGFVD